MTDQPEFDTTPPAGDAAAGARPSGDAGASADPASEAPGEGGSARAREWVSQLETMIQDIATQAAPVARQVGAKAAELAAVAAIKAGPLAHRAAEATTDAGQRFAEKAQAVAAELRGEPEAAAPPTEPVSWPDATESTGDEGTPSI